MSSYLKSQNAEAKMVRDQLQFVSGRQFNTVMVVPNYLQANNTYRILAQNYLASVAKAMNAAESPEQLQAIMEKAQNVMDKANNAVPFNETPTIPAESSL